MAGFFHIYMVPKQSVTKEQLNEKLNKALDWFRYAPNNYIVYSTSDEEKLYARFESLVKPEGSIFICKLDITSRQGWINKGLWTWLKKPR